MGNEPLKKADISSLKGKIAQNFNYLNKEAAFFLSHGEVTNAAYVLGGKSIKIITKKGHLNGHSASSRFHQTSKAMSKIVKKNITYAFLKTYLCKL